MVCADASARFYAQWIENAVRGTFDRNARCFAPGRALSRGYVSLRELNDTDARIPVCWPDGAARGRYAGRRLLGAGRGSNIAVATVGQHRRA